MSLLQRLPGLAAHRYFLTLLAVITLVVMLFFGLRPRTWPNVNRVEWAGSGKLVFHSPGIAYTDNLTRLAETATSGELSICLAVSSALQHPGFRPILMLHDGIDAHQFTIAQWNTTIIVMNGDDYSYRRKLPRISSDQLLENGVVHYIGVTSGQAETRLYADGRLVSEKTSMQLTIPMGGDQLRLILGNSIYGNSSWEGIIHYLSIYNRRLTSKEMVDCGPEAAKTGGPSNPLLLYTFSGIQGDTVEDLTGNGQSLQLPHQPMALKQIFLAPPSPDFHFSRPLLIDILLNFWGFVPLGVILYVRLYLSHLPVNRAPARIAMTLCISLSLGIELSQGLLPNRSSSLLDLLFNCGGAATGILLAKYFRQRFPQPPRL